MQHRAIERKRTQRISYAITQLKNELESQKRFINKNSKSEILLGSIQHAIDCQALIKNAIYTGYKPTVINLVSQATEVIEAEAKRTAATLPRVSDEMLDDVDLMSKEAKRRALHRVVERRRTNRINEYISHMKAILIAEKYDLNEKSNKSTILNFFLEYVKSLGREASLANFDLSQRILVFNTSTSKFEESTSSTSMNEHSTRFSMISRSRYSKLLGSSDSLVSQARESTPTPPIADYDVPTTFTSPNVKGDDENMWI